MGKKRRAADSGKAYCCGGSVVSAGGAVSGSDGMGVRDGLVDAGLFTIWNSALER